MLMHRLNTDPFRTMELLFDSMLPQAAKRPQAGVRRTNFARKTGQVFIDEQPDSYVLRAELPGVLPEALELEVGEDWIELSIKREVAAPEGYQALRRERPNFQFNRRLTLAKRIDGDKVEATLRDGVLTVTMPKHASVQPRTVAIKAA